MNEVQEIFERLIKDTQELSYRLSEEAKYLEEQIYWRRINNMRDINRIDNFCNELAKIWKENCPDWRFGQFMVNVLGALPIDPFFPEEDKMLEYIKDFFKKEDNK